MVSSELKEWLSNAKKYKFEENTKILFYNKIRLVI